ncbi:uncharacterized protein C6orf163 homolog [Coregonus clupeaformis]|uniref:uncharacterized protein C6orf163 homolog n=1 Tax=Coregonus clupeaformis TaxID=59861 RepID=UPI001BE0D7C5|nr:uncharacterized protein C6orf163 homolog [Coregonus clupeaformis]
MKELKQLSTHSNIIDIGENIHQYYMTEFQKEKEECIRAATEEAWGKADLEMEKIVLETLQLARKERELLRRKVENANSYLQETLVEYDIKTKRKVRSDIEKLRERNEERASQEIRGAIEKIAQRHAKSVVRTRRKEKQTTAHAATILEMDFMLQPEDAKAVASKKKDEILAEVRAVMISSIAGNIERTRREEKDIAQHNIVEAEGRYKAELTALKESTQELQTLLDKTIRDLRTAIADKQVYMDDLEETRAAFQHFINQQFKELKPDQADFILPSKKMYRLNDK